MSNRQQGGSPGGVFVMGAIAGLICSPCTTAPLSAILLYIAQSGNLWLGGGTLYLYALGMGLPLILVTVFGNRLLPKSGPWMETVKTAFGFVILALPVFLLERIIGDVWGMRLWAMLGVASSVGRLSQAGSEKAVDESGANPPARRRAGERTATAGLGIWHTRGTNAGAFELHPDKERG